MEVKLSSSNWDTLQMETNKNLVFKAMKVQLTFPHLYCALSIHKEKLNSGLFIRSVVRDLLEAGRSMYCTIRTEL